MVEQEKDWQKKKEEKQDKNREEDKDKEAVEQDLIDELERLNEVD